MTNYSVFKSNLFLAFGSICILLCSICILPEVVTARPGGGHSYSGGGGSHSGGGSSGGSSNSGSSSKKSSSYSHSSSNSSDDDDFGSNRNNDGGEVHGTLPGWLLVLFFLGFVITFRVGHSSNHHTKTSVKNQVPTDAYGANNYYVQSVGNLVYHEPQAAVLSRKQKIDNLTAQDKNFSEVLFLDFAHLLYHKFYTNLNTSKMRELTPFLSDKLVQFVHLKMNKLSPRLEVVVGSLYISDVSISNSEINICVDFQSNYTTQQDGKNYRHILTERWLLSRNSNVPSASPKAMQELACPSCGGPNDFNDASICGHCGTHIKAGEMNWRLDRIIVQEHQHFHIESIGTYAPERGTNLPVIIDPDLKKISAQFLAMHKIDNATFFWAEFLDSVLKPTFITMYRAWSSRDNWNAARHLLSDRLYESNAFWIKTYKEKDYYNRLKNIDLQKSELVKISIDNLYESVTFRIFASVIDYTEHSSGKLIGGDKNKARRFSEYWTFIRKIGVEKPESQFDTKNCPNCGAPADKMSDSAICGYCSAKTNLGDFSWVLSNITQDEAYQG